MTFDSRKGREIVINYKGNIYAFKESESGLYYYETSKINNSFIQTVTNNETKYTKKDIKNANEVTDVQQYFFWPSTKNVNNYIDGNQILNCHLTGQDIETRDHIYGTPIPLLRGKMLRQRPMAHNREPLVQIPTVIAKRYMKVNMFMDLFFVNGNAFLHIKSEKINYRSSQSLKTKAIREIVIGIGIVKNKY